MARASGAGAAAVDTELDRLGDLAQRAQPVSLARQQILPVLPAFEGLLPEPGLRRGTVTRVHGPGATSLALALLAGCTAAGSWVAAIGVRHLGLGAAGELGLALERLLLVDAPAPQWATAVAAALDGVDAVMLEVPSRARPADARRLQSRLRERGAVVVLVGPAGSFQADVVLTASAPSWEGLGLGWGHLGGRRLAVEVTGRRAASRSRTTQLWLPDAQGHIRREENRRADEPERRVRREEQVDQEVVIPLRPVAVG